MALALELFRSAPRYVAARTVGRRVPGLIAGPLAPLRLVTPRDPEPRGEGWARVKPLLSGICGSDLATMSGSTSFYFTPLVSLPFVPGHEVVGDLLDDCGDLGAASAWCCRACWPAPPAGRSRSVRTAQRVTSAGATA